MLQILVVNWLVARTVVVAMVVKPGNAVLIVVAMGVALIQITAAKRDKLIINGPKFEPS